MNGEWQEIVEAGRHEFRREFMGTAVVIRKHPIADAWVCKLPNGARLIGELRDVKSVAECVMSIKQN